MVALAVDNVTATLLLNRWLDPAREVVDVRQLNGGMVNRVWTWRLDGQPDAMVAKINAFDKAGAFEDELAALNWYRRRTAFPVPAPYVCFADEQLGLSGMLMERIEAASLADARLSQPGRKRLQEQLAAHVASLHTHTRDCFGSARPGDPGCPRWLDAFAPVIERDFQAVRDRLGASTRATISQVIDQLDRWLPEQATPTLVHGDLWATNILVDDLHADRPRLLAFIDPRPAYVDPEYELAYLRLFHTADETFFRHYGRQHPLRSGFDRRCRIYWLDTMLVHVHRFGDRYLPACDDLARQLRRLA